MLSWDFYLELDRHKELLAEAERRLEISRLLAPEQPAPGVRARLAATVGHWMVAQGRRLEARTDLSATVSDRMPRPS